MRKRERERERAFILSTSTAFIRSLITQGNGMPGEKRGRNGRGKERSDGKEVVARRGVHAPEWQCSKIAPHHHHNTSCHLHHVTCQGTKTQQLHRLLKQAPAFESSPQEPPPLPVTPSSRPLPPTCLLLNALHVSYTLLHVVV